MAEYALDPAFVRLDYITDYAPHVQLIPTRAWIPTSITGMMGSYLDWNGAPRDAEDMIDDLITRMIPFQDPTSAYTLATIFTKAAPAAPAIAQRFKSLAVVGTSAAGGVRKAVQATFNFKSSAGGASKLVFLDYPHGVSQFDKQTLAGLSGTPVALFNELSSLTNAWAARDKTRLAAFLSVTNTLNEKLRKQYKMG